jgi:UDP-N-acetyl-D-mannosaminuronic acid dehydrogenase
MKELCENDRIIGGVSEACAKAAIDLYKIFVKGNCIATKVRTAETCKLVENSFRDVNIAFANELSVICEKLDIDIWELIALANRHPRVNILKPGPGVGGHCIAVDPWFIVHQAPNDAKLIRTAREVNDKKPHWVLMQVQKVLNDLLSASIKKNQNGITIACFGLAFKADIDDLRESPALEIAETLNTTYPSQVVCVEPNLKNPSNYLATQNLKFVDAHIGLTADIILMLVAHQDFANLKPNLRSDQRLIDTKGLWNSELLEKC